MLLPCGDGDDDLAGKHPARLEHCYRHSAVRSAVVAQLAGAIEPPCREGAIGAQYQAVILPRCEGDDGLAGEHPARLRHCHRRIAVSGAVVAQLTIAVVTPRCHRTV